MATKRRDKHHEQQQSDLGKGQLEREQKDAGEGKQAGGELDREHEKDLEMNRRD